jgi:hypothetical protein
MRKRKIHRHNTRVLKADEAERVVKAAFAN